MRFVPPTLAAVAVLALAGCGSSSQAPTAPPATPQPTAAAQDFPTAKGKTLETLRHGLQKGPILATTNAA